MPVRVRPRAPMIALNVWSLGYIESFFIMDISNLKLVYGVLSKVYRDGAYSNIALNHTLKDNPSCDTASVTHMVYGVLKYDTQLEWITKQLVTKSTKASLIVLLKMGIFALRYTKTPHYATVDSCVQLAKVVFKGGVTGLTNAVLKKSIDLNLPKLDKTPHSLSINYSCPQWIVELMIKEHGIDTTVNFLSCELDYRTHIRPNLAVIDRDTLYKKLQSVGDVSTSKLGFYVDAKHLKALDNKEYAIQSLSSMLVINALGSDNIGEVLDLCAAPGGKSVYYLQNNPKARLIACDIHAHKLDLIRNYAEKMSVSKDISAPSKLLVSDKTYSPENLSVSDRIEVFQNDATVYNEKWENKFDTVLCDVPCSGLGLVYSKHDIVLNIKKENIKSLTKIQTQILHNASLYTKQGGKILYSTCTTTKSENEQIITEFLKTHPDFKLQPVHNEYINTNSDNFIRLWPHVDGTDGFFGAVLQRL